MEKPSDLLNPPQGRVFTAGEDEQKRLFYDKMSPRRRRFVDRIGFDNWDPFEAPKEPMDMRKDISERTVQQLLREFLRNVPKELHDGEYSRGALECALGMVAREEKYRGALDFCVWYHELLQKERANK